MNEVVKVVHCKFVFQPTFQRMGQAFVAYLPDQQVCPGCQPT